MDYRIEGKSGIPLFLCGVVNRDKARLTTIMLGYFHRHGLSFESIIVFEDQAEIPRVDLARLSIDREALRRGGVVGVVSYVREPAGIESVIPQTPTRDLHPAVRVLRTPPHRRLDPLAGV